jgi:selenocysteine lyase/cysteine desulfurase
MRAHDDPGHLDFVALSAHKMYAPFGTGALVGGRDWFRGEPDHAGGGTIRAVTVDDVAWADLPDREEAGSPNVVGTVALAAAIKVLKQIGLERIAAHESELAHYAVARLAGVPGVRLHGPAEHEAPGIVGRKVGVIPFTVDGIDHGLVAAVLGYEHGVGVRHGCFCAQPYIHHLLGVDRIESTWWLDRARVDEHRGARGMVRISLGAYNDMADIDRAVRALEWLVAGEVQGRYRADSDGSFVPDGYVEPLLFDLGPLGISD